jgi:hypothetical protein
MKYRNEREYTNRFIIHFIDLKNTRLQPNEYLFVAQVSRFGNSLHCKLQSKPVLSNTSTSILLLNQIFKEILGETILHYSKNKSNKSHANLLYY